VGHVQAGVVEGQVGIAAVAEDAFHEIQVGHQAAGREEAGLHALLRHQAGHFRGNQGAQQQGHPQARLLVLVGGEGQPQQLGGRIHGRPEQGGEGGRRHRLLVPGDGQAALHHMEHALGGAPVLLGVVQHALPHPVGGQPGRFEAVAVGRQGQFRRQPRTVQHEAGGGQFHPAGHAVAGQIAVDEVLDAPIRRAAIAAQQAAVLAIVAQQVVGDVQQVVAVAAPAGLVQGGQLQVDLADAPQAFGRDGTARQAAGAREIVFHGKCRAGWLRPLFSH
jgi:hypothetical protein